MAEESWKAHEMVGGFHGRPGPSRPSPPHRANPCAHTLHLCALLAGRPLPYLREAHTDTLPQPRQSLSDSKMSGHDDHVDHDHHDHEYDVEMRMHTRSLRIASIFVLLAASAVGAMLPLLQPSRWRGDGLLARVARAMGAGEILLQRANLGRACRSQAARAAKRGGDSAGTFAPSLLYTPIPTPTPTPPPRVGVILSLAMVHIYPEGVEQLHEAAPGYPHLGGVIAIAGTLVLLVVDAAVRAFFMRATASSSSFVDSHAPHADGAELALGDAPHSHVCLHTSSAEALGRVLASSGKAGAEPPMAQRRAAYMMEAGCIAHSVIIGIDLGLMGGAPAEVAAMIGALAFHPARRRPRPPPSPRAAPAAFSPPLISRRSRN